MIGLLYKLRLPEYFSRIHNVFYAEKLRKAIIDFLPGQVNLELKGEDINRGTEYKVQEVLVVELKKNRF